MIGYKTAIGLDFGRDAVKVVRAERNPGGGVVFTHAAMLRLPGESTDTRPVVKRWLESLELPGDSCVVGLPGRSIILKSIELEATDPRTPAQAAGLEIQKLRKLTSEDMIYDVKEISPSRAGIRRVLLFVVRPEILESTLAQPLGLGLDVREVTPGSVALFNLAKRFLPIDSSMPDVLLDIGHKTTELIVGDCRGIRFVRSFDIGAGRFSEALAVDGKVSPAQAHEQLQNDAGIFENSPPALTEALKAWYGEIGLSLDIYKDRFPEIDDVPRQLLLAGGGALMKGLSAGLSQRFPFTPVRFPLIPLPGESADPLVYALAAGLALTGVGKDVSRVSLAPPAIKERAEKQKNRLTLAAAAGVVLLAAVTMGLDARLNQRYASQSQEEAERAIATRQQLQARLDQLQKENRLLLESLRPVYSALEGRVALLDILGAVSESRKGSDWFVSLATVAGGVGGLDAITAVGAKTNGLAVMPSFLARGYTPDAGFYSVRTMIDRLRRTPRVVNADLMEESALNVTDSLAAHWATLNAIPFALTIRTTSPKPFSLPLSETVRDPLPQSQAGLVAVLRAQETLTRDILTAWTVIVKRFTTFKTKDDLFSLSPQSDVAFIDFRVALQEARHKLTKAAKGLHIPIPADLGLGEAAVKDKDVRTLLFQLGAIHKWVEIALESHVSSITRLEPLEPVLQSAGSQVTMEQYPFRVVFTGRFSSVLTVLSELGDETHYMVIRQAVLTRPDSAAPDLLEVTLEVAALEFPDPPDAATFTALARHP
jgi:Tfp pilus assembly PilM family ATPase